MRHLIILFAIASCVPSMGAEPPVLTADSVVGRRLVEMFTAGYEPGSEHLKQARRSYVAALDESKGDPRVEYALGLVLVKQLKNQEAVSHFQKAAHQSGSDYWPAWQALIWSHFVARDYARGYDRVKAYARRMVDPQSPTDMSERRQSAEWIGQVIAALQKSVDTVKQREALLNVDEELKDILGPDLVSSMDRGKINVNSLHSAMEEDVQQTREQALDKQKKEAAEKEAQLAKDLEASAEKREALKKTAEDQKKYLDERLAECDKTLKRLERDYEFLQKRTLSITLSQAQLNTEMATLDQQVANLSSNSNNSRSPSSNGNLLANAYRQRMAVLEVQILRYQVELDQTLGSAMVVSKQAQFVVGQRVAAIRQYERATGQLVQEDSKLDHWQDRLKKDGEKLKTPPKGKSQAVANKIKQARSFRTYVDLDLLLERDRLLDSFGVAMPEAPEKSNGSKS
ncbi:MAG: hypothetical protein JSS49_21900 [Planctomycetes bacterium]|nr:hypothetical protein [Planctomycetota bacterium]